MIYNPLCSFPIPVPKGVYIENEGRGFILYIFSEKGLQKIDEGLNGFEKYLTYLTEEQRSQIVAMVDEFLRMFSCAVLQRQQTMEQDEIALNKAKEEFEEFRQAAVRQAAVRDRDKCDHKTTSTKISKFKAATVVVALEKLSKSTKEFELYDSFIKDQRKEFEPYLALLHKYTIVG